MARKCRGNSVFLPSLCTICARRRLTYSSANIKHTHITIRDITPTTYPQEHRAHIPGGRR